MTKKVDGGEMKKFKFELYTMDGSEKTVLDTKSTADDSNNLQTVTFAEQKIGPLKVSDFNDDKATFTYYICECAADAGEGTSHKGYTNDTKTFKVVVTATDDGEGHLTCTPAYYEVDASGNANSTRPTPHLHQHLLHLFAPFWYVGRHSDVPCRRGGALRCCGLDAHSSQGECEGR